MTNPHLAADLTADVFLVYAGLAAAAAAGVAVLLLPGTGAHPAYAVTTDGDGDVHVRVHSLADADGREQALSVQGVASDVRYLPDDTECAPGRYDDEPNTTGDFGAVRKLSAMVPGCLRSSLSRRS